MKIQFLDGATLAFLRSALAKPASKEQKKVHKQVCELFMLETNVQLLQFLREKSSETPLRDSRFDCSPLELDPHPVGRDEITNVKKVMETLANISPAVAANEKFWAGLCIGHAWKFVRDRWNILEDHSGENILTHYLFGYGARRSLTRNALARLWWIGHLTRDDGNTVNPFEATEFALEKLDHVVALLERNTSDNKRIVIESVQGILAARAEGFEIDRLAVRELAKYVNIVGGVELLDLLPTGAIKDKVLLRARKICKKKEN